MARKELYPEDIKVQVGLIPEQISRLEPVMRNEFIYPTIGEDLSSNLFFDDIDSIHIKIDKSSPASLFVFVENHEGETVDQFFFEFKPNVGSHKFIYENYNEMKHLYKNEKSEKLLQSITEKFTFLTNPKKNIITVDESQVLELMD